MGKETILFKSEEKKDTHSVAVLLRELADKIDQRKVVLIHGRQTVKLKIPAAVELEIKVEKEEGRKKTKKKLEIEIQWVVGQEHGKESQSLSLG